MHAAKALNFLYPVKDVYVYIKTKSVLPCFCYNDMSQVDFPNHGHMLLPIFPSFRPMGMVGEACFYRYFLRSGLCAWWAKLAYQVMLNIRGRLITPFILGSMSVGLNILIRHSFMDL